MKDILDSLEANGQLRQLVRAGIISPKILFYRELSSMVEAYVTTRKYQRTQAIDQVAFDFRITPRTVMRAVAFMRALEGDRSVSGNQ